MRRLSTITATPLFALLALCAALWLCSAHALAQSVGVSIASQQTFVDSPVRMVVAIEDAETFDGPFIPEVDGLEIRRLPGEQTSTSFQIVNGRTTRKKSVAISFEVIPKRVGSFVIPPFEVDINGTRQKTREIPITAVVSETGDLMLVGVESRPKTLYVGQKGSLDLLIAVRRFRDKDLGITLDEGDLWSLIDRNSQFGVFGPTLARLGSENRRPRGEPEIIGDTEYIVFRIEKPFDPISTGTPELGDIRVRMDYPTKLRRGNDFFFENRLQLAGSRPISAAPAKVEVEVLTPPEGGRPASWNGAVGDFEVSAVAKPTDVAVGDPITLTLKVTDRSGSAGLEGLQAPALGAQDAFRGGFRVPEDAAAGAVEGRSKIFTVSIRATSESVQEIPPIEFSSFDPATGSYGTVRTAPIPLRVRAASVVRLTDDDARAASSTREAPTRLEGGLLANAAFDELVAKPMSLRLDPADILAFGAAPAVLAVAWFRLRREEGDARDPAAKRRRGAGAIARARLAQASDADALAVALRSYIADRLGAPEGSLTRRECVEALAACGASAESTQALDQFLERCERARYAGAPVSAQDALPILERLEKIELRRTTNPTQASSAGAAR